MEGAGICPAIAMALVAAGEEQVIQVDHRTLLEKAMAALGAREKPVYNIYKCGSGRTRVGVKLNVSGVKISVGEDVRIVELTGDTTQSRMEAEKTAVREAFKYLSEKHLVKIRDFSSMVADEIDPSEAFGHVNAAVYSITKLLAKWHLVMDKCQSIVVTLAGKEMAARQDGGPNGHRAVYAALNESIQQLIDIYKPRLTEAKTSADEMECQRKKYHSGTTEKYHAELMQGHRQEICLTAKDVLGYVLTYLGAGKPKYSNGPIDGGVVKGVVKFKIPEKQGLEVCGKIKIKGKATNSRAAEEDAAFRALLYMEKKYSLQIVDHNHAERVEAEKQSKMLVWLLERLLKVADNVNKYWNEMMEGINTAKGACVYAASGEDEMESHVFCINIMEELQEEAAQRYGECAFSLQQLDKLGYKLNALKSELDMD